MLTTFVAPPPLAHSKNVSPPADSTVVESVSHKVSTTMEITVVVIKVLFVDGFKFTVNMKCNNWICFYIVLVCFTSVLVLLLNTYSLCKGVAGSG